MKFRNMKEIGEYIKQLEQEGQELEYEKKMLEDLSAASKFIRKFNSMLVTEIGD